MSGGWGTGAPASGPADAPGADETESSENPDASPSQDEDPPSEASEASESKHESGYDAIRPGDYAFMPVVSFNAVRVAAAKYRGEPTDGPQELAGRELTWWEDDSIIPKHPFMLVNPLESMPMNHDEHSLRDILRYRKGDQFVFSDSGGYQIMSQDDAQVVHGGGHSFPDHQIDPKRLLEWQVENADAGATLDFPPYNLSGDNSFPDSVEFSEEWEEFFDRRLKQSQEATEAMAVRLAQLRNEGSDAADDYLFTPVIHGKPHPSSETHEFVGRWHSAMLDASSVGGVYPRGWVLKPEPSKSFGQIALHLGYAAEHLDSADYIHVLMVGGLLQKALIMFYAMKTGQFVTSDASSYAAGGKRRQFDLPKTASRRAVIISEREDGEDDSGMDKARLDRYPCRCHVCAAVEREHGFEFIAEGSGNVQSCTLNLHNLQQVLSVERTMDALMREEDATIVETGGEPAGCEFWRYLSSMAQERRIADLYRAMDYVRLAADEGLDAAESRYEIRWSQRNGKTIEAISGGSASDASW